MGNEENSTQYFLTFVFSSLSQSCANQLIQDAMMYRFLLFPGQDSMTWQDEVKFTEMMGEGNAFPDATSANRKVNFKIL